MQRRKVSDSVPHLKSRGATLKSKKPTPGVPEAEQLGMGDPSDSSAGHDKGAGAAKPSTAHKGPDRTK